MDELRGFQPAVFIASVRFVQGYRYLDRCGDILVRLENELNEIGEGWIPAESSPQRGVIRSFDMGMELQFSSESMVLKQDELVIDEQFFAVAGMAYEIICGQIEIERLLSPVFRAIYKKPCSSIEEADRALNQFRIVLPSPKLLSALGGDPNALHIITTRESDDFWDEAPVHLRHRIKIEGTGQLTQPPYDDRLVKRIRTMPANQADALKQLLSVRSKFVPNDTFAITLDIERSLEDEFPYRSFQYRNFLDVGKNAVQKIVSQLVST